MGGMIGVEDDDRLGIDIGGQGGIPTLQGDFQQEQMLAIRHGGALGQPQDLADRDCAQGDRFFSDTHPLARPGTVPEGLRFGQIGLNPGIEIVTPPIPLDQEGDGLPTGDLALPVVLNVGTVLGSLPQFHADVLSFLPQIGGDGGVAHKAGIVPANAFLTGIRVVQYEDIQIQGHPATGQGGDGGLRALEQMQQGYVHPGQERFAFLVQALPQGGTRRHHPQPRGLGEEGAPAKPLNGLKVALTLTEQAQLRDQDIAVEYAAAHREARLDEPTQLRVSGYGLANQGQAPQGGEGLWALAKVKSRRFHAHPTGQPKKSALCNIKQSVGIDFRRLLHGFR